MYMCVCVCVCVYIYIFMCVCVFFMDFKGTYESTNRNELFELISCFRILTKLVNLVPLVIGGARHVLNTY